MDSSLISTVLLPLALAIIMLGLGLALTLNDFKRIIISPKAVFVGSITQLVVLPALGMLIKSKFESFANKAQSPVKILSAVFLVLIIVTAILKEKSNIAEFFAVAGPAVLLLNLSGMTIGYFLPLIFKLNSSQQLTISIETSIQNGTLAIGIASSPMMLNNSTMAIPAAVYSIIMFVTAGIFISILNKRRKNNASV